MLNLARKKLKNKELTLAFVHLGKRKPVYLRSNVQRIQKIFPNLRIFIIHDEQSRNFVKKISGTELYEYKRISRSDFLPLENENGKKFRQGFWQFTIERIFALTQFHQENREISILHIESDVLLFPNFPIQKIANSENINWCRFNETKDVASILFLPNYKESLWLERELFREIRINTDVTDMTALSKISIAHKSRVNILPSLADDSESLINRNSRLTPEDAKLLRTNYDLYQGIFDPASIGMWLCGIDPENNHGKLNLHDSNFIDSGDSFINPSNTKYRLSKENELFFKSKEKWIPIFNLHVHSKDYKLLSIHAEGELEKFVLYSEMGNGLLKKKIESYFRVYSKHVKERDLLRYMCTHPKIYLFVKKLLKLVKNE